MSSDARHAGWLAALGVVLALVAIPCATSAATRHATLTPLWGPQAQFAGYYVAAEKGFYARRGVDLKILDAGPGQDPASALAEGRADFAVLWLSTALRRRAAGEPFVNVAQTVQRSSMLLVARKSSGIRRPEDLHGRKVGLWSGDLSIPPRALFSKVGVQPHEITQSYTVNLFLRGGIEVASAMWFNEYHTILSAGIDADELSVLRLDDYGLKFPEDGLYTLEHTLQRDPALVAAVVEGSLEGWRYAFDHPEEALDIVLQRMRAAHISANRVHQRWMLLRLRDLATPAPGQPFGELEPGACTAVAQVLLAQHVIAHEPDCSGFVRKRNAAP